MVYVGSTKNINDRWRRHYQNAINGTGYKVNKHICELGCDKFNMTVVRTIEVECKRDAEKYEDEELQKIPVEFRLNERRCYVSPNEKKKLNREYAKKRYEDLEFVDNEHKRRKEYYEKQREDKEWIVQFNESRREMMAKKKQENPEWYRQYKEKQKNYYQTFRRSEEVRTVENAKSRLRYAEIKVDTDFQARRKIYRKKTYDKKKDDPQFKQKRSDTYKAWRARQKEKPDYYSAENIEKRRLKAQKDYERQKEKKKLKAEINE